MGSRYESWLLCSGKIHMNTNHDVLEFFVGKKTETNSWQGDRTKKVGVVDSEYIVHTGLPTLGGSDEKMVSYWNIETN